MKFIRLVFASPFLVIGLIAMALFFVIAGRRNASDLQSALLDFMGI